MSYQERTPKSKMKATKKSQKQKRLKPTKWMKIIPWDQKPLLVA
jgi:hypothetical protein